MSLQTWKKEFYPIPVDKVKPEDSATHSFTKWQGLLPVNLKRHKLTLLDNIIKDSQGNVFYINSVSCSLCEIFYNDSEDESCARCPLFINGFKCMEDSGPYSKFEEGFVGPMVMALELVCKKYSGDDLIMMGKNAKKEEHPTPFSVSKKNNEVTDADGNVLLWFEGEDLEIVAKIIDTFNEHCEE